jgi:hypothetical protein
MKFAPHTHMRTRTCSIASFCVLNLFLFPLWRCFNLHIFKQPYNWMLFDHIQWTFTGFVNFSKFLSVLMWCVLCTEYCKGHNKIQYLLVYEQSVLQVLTYTNIPVTFCCLVRQFVFVQAVFLMLAACCAHILTDPNNPPTTEWRDLLVLMCNVCYIITYSNICAFSVQLYWCNYCLCTG